MRQYAMVQLYCCGMFVSVGMIVDEPCIPTLLLGIGPKCSNGATGHLMTCIIYIYRYIVYYIYIRKIWLVFHRRFY